MSNKKKSDYKMDMCTGPILKKMLIFTIPLMFSSVLQLLFNAADIVVVGRFSGDNSLAAVGSNSAIIGLITNLFVGLSVGANVLAAKYFGAKRDKNLERTIHTSMLLSILSGLLLTVVGVVGAKQILIWMQTPEEVLDLAVTYLRIYFLGMTATMIYNFGSALLRAVGDTRRPLYYLFYAGIVNVILNLFFVMLLNMDVAGVAAATVISQFISAGLVLLCLINEKGSMNLDLKKLHINKDIFLEILRIGLPAGFQGILFSLSNVIIQSSVNSFGAVTMAGNSAAANIEQFVYFAMNAFYQAAISFTSQNYGAKNIDRIYKILIRSQLCVIVVGVVFGNLEVIFGDSLLKIYTSNQEVIAAGKIRFRYVARTYALCGMMDVMVGVMRGIGYSILPMIVSLMGACVFRIIWISTIFKTERFHSVQTVYASYPISWVITIAVHIICFVWAIKKVKETFFQDNVIPA